MPVEVSDIVQAVMDTGDSSYTGCEEAVSGSDEYVRKMAGWVRDPWLSNQIHIANQHCQRKPWKSRPISQFSLQRRADNRCAFSATQGTLFWKTRKQNHPAIYIPDAY